MSVRILNANTCSDEDLDGDCVYVGRGSQFGNPYRIGRDGTRKQVIEKYRALVNGDPSLQASIRTQLRGKSLVCFCHPLPCHAQVLAEIANS